MKVVDRKTFLALPPGTVYAKFGHPTELSIDMGPLCIKTDYRGSTDWFALELPGWPAHHDDRELIDVFDRLMGGEDLAPDLDTGTDDGLFDQDQMFAVLSENDIRALYNRFGRILDDLQKARDQAWGNGGGGCPF